MCPSLLQVDIIRCVHIASMTSNYNSVQTASAGRLFAKKSPQKVFGQISGGVARTSCDSALAKLVCDSGMQSKELSQGQVSDILVLCSAQRHPGVRSLLYSTAGASWFSFSTSGSSSVPLPSIRLLNSTSSCR